MTREKFGAVRPGVRGLVSGVAGLVLLLAAWSGALAQEPRDSDPPSWFVETFLDFRDDVREAAQEGKRVLLYFGQDGCPYCARLMQVNFTQPRIVEKTRKHFLPIAINIWGDREVTWVDGKTMGEKAFAQYLKIQFTPTILLLDEKGGIVARLNGYYPPHRFEAALDYAAGRHERTISFADYMRKNVRDAASEKLHDEPFFSGPPHALARKGRTKPLAAVFETPYCSGCDELHREGFRRPEIQALLPRFDFVRFALGERTPIETPDGRRTRADAWARELKIVYTPTIVFFGPEGREVFRIEAYLRPFHLASALEYVASGAYRTEPSFQRFIQARAGRMREAGQKVDLWK